MDYVYKGSTHKKKQCSFQYFRHQLEKYYEPVNTSTLIANYNVFIQIVDKSYN